MIGEKLGARSFDKSHPNGLQSPSSSQLTRIRKLLNTEARAAAADDSEREFFSNNKFVPGC